MNNYDRRDFLTNTSGMLLGAGLFSTLDAKAIQYIEQAGRQKTPICR